MNMALVHSLQSYQALIPRYVSRFRCVGSACEDNCCTGWKVSIDKDTYNAYRQVKLPSLAGRLHQAIKRVDGQTPKVMWARIELDPQTQECPLLDERMCSVQGQLGEDLLSDTCYSYPRLTRHAPGHHEQALTLSCPEAARLALLEADAFEFQVESIQVRPTAVSMLATPPGLPAEVQHEVRTFCIQLMRTDGLQLWERLALLGVLCEQLDDRTIQRPVRVQAVLKDFTELVASGQAVEALQAMKPYPQVQATAFAGLWQMKITSRSSAAQTQVQEAIAHGLGADTATGRVSDLQLVDRYCRGITRLPDALKSAPNLLEHFLLNELFTQGFPFGMKTPYQHYLQLVTRFGLLRFMLAAHCAGDGPLPDAVALVRCVHVCARRFHHDQRFSEKVAEILKCSGWDTLERVYRFLRS
jgi:lysine-N-methylase